MNDHTFGIGRKIRTLRLEKSLTLDQLAERTALTKSHLSSIERDLSSPSVASLIAICQALGVSVGSLFSEPENSLVRRDERKPIEFGGEGVDDFLLTSRSNSKIQVILSQMRPGATAGDALYRLEADEEFVFVLEGDLEIRFETETVQLETGDAFKFSPRLPHSFSNRSKEKRAVAMYVFTPPVR